MTLNTIEKIATNTKFTQNHLWLEVNNTKVAKQFLINFEEIFALWASMMGKKSMIIKTPGKNVEVPASMAKHSNN